MTDEETYRRQAAVEIEGPWRFQMLRIVQGLTKPSVVADGCMFDDGCCVMRWRGEHWSTAVYAKFDDMKAVHGHDGTSFVWLDEERSKEFSAGVSDCVQDSCENCPFASIGGLAARENPVPKYAKPGAEPEYLRGYIAAARAMYGSDWQTCEFSWAPAIVIGKAETTT